MANSTLKEEYEERKKNQIMKNLPFYNSQEKNQLPPHAQLKTE